MSAAGSRTQRLVFEADDANTVGWLRPAAEPKAEGRRSHGLPVTTRGSRPWRLDTTERHLLSTRIPAQGAEGFSSSQGCDQWIFRFGSPTHHAAKSLFASLPSDLS